MLSIIAGKQKTLVLGNLDATRDWGHAKDYVNGMWLMLQQTYGDDYILATGEPHTVREFVEMTWKKCGHEISWQGSSTDEVAIGPNGDVVVEISEEFYRPAEVEYLLGDPSKAKEKLGWKIENSFENLVDYMLAKAKQELA